MDSYGWHQSRFGMFGGGFLHGRLGATSPEELEQRSQEAVAKYQALLKRATKIRDPRVREEVLRSVGNESALATPAERYRSVLNDLANGAPWDEIRTEHLDDLEQANRDLETRVVVAEQSGTYDERDPLRIVGDDGRLTGTGVALVVVGAIGLFLVPLTLGK
jgi:hypothetical protein